MRTLAILPVKRFELAKTRLGEQLPAPQRRRLAEAMVADVLDALSASPGLDAVVVTNEPAVASLAGAAGAGVLADAAESGQSAAALVGIAHALRNSYGRALLVPGDCPALDGPALRTLLDSPADAPAVTIVPDRHGSGTNALLLTPPDVIEPGFGPGSFARHRRRAAAAGAAWRVERLEPLMLDLDTPDDLVVLRVALAGHPTRTGALLEEF
ncbi:MAG: 2-phospho-L-lactate guanylyltransferase [Solirubrobacteraceae bacterium]|jgi:2-phospho-L-lactate guanylyltransferase